MQDIADTTVANGGAGVAKPIDTGGVAGPIGEALATLSERNGEDVSGLFRKMCDGDTKAMTKIVVYMRDDFTLANAVVRHTDGIITNWLKHWTGDEFSRVVLETRTKDLRRSLLGDTPTQLERLLVERIAVCSLQVQIADAQYMSAMKQGTTLPRAEFFERLMDRAQRRYLGAIKALAQVRRLQLPTVTQLNVATNQVNIAQSADAPTDDRPPALPDHDLMTIEAVLAGEDEKHVASRRDS